LYRYVKAFHVSAAAELEMCGAALEEAKSSFKESARYYGGAVQELNPADS
jgi:hypothetical protein